MHINILTPKILREIAQEIALQGARANFVGGYVRDFFFGGESKDIDVEVFGLKVGQLQNILSNFGEPKLEGKAFAAFKLNIAGEDYDFTLPRTENKVGVGHKGFEVIANPNMTETEAASRRDFTINSIAVDILTGQVIDPFGGIQDINNKILKPVNLETFIEDPLRVFRAFQFISRFNLFPDKLTMQVCKDIVKSGEIDSIPKERIEIEFMKWATKGVALGQGIQFLRKINAFNSAFEDFNFANVAELDVIGMALKECEDKNRSIFAIATLFSKSENISLKVEDIFDNNQIIKRVNELIHVTKRTVLDGYVKGMIALLEMRHNSFDDFFEFIEYQCDSKFFRTLCDEYYEVTQFEPSVKSKDLIELGLKPGKEFGQALKKSLELQLSGTPKNKILDFLKIKYL